MHKLWVNFKNSIKNINSLCTNVFFSYKIALESMDDHPDTNSKADFSKTSQTIRMLLNDLAKMQKLATINEHSISYNPIESTHFL